MHLDSRHTLEVDTVELAFGSRRILQSVYVAVATGEVVALLGRNGCGKSCLMKIIVGLLSATSKSVRIDSVWRKQVTCREVMYLSQHCSIPNDLTVETVFRDFELSLDGFYELFPDIRFGQSQKIGTLSGGEKRVLECYLVLMSDSLFALLDEPFSAVMPVHVERIKTMIDRAKQRKGVLVSDHKYQDVMGVSDSVYVISNLSTYRINSVDDLTRYGYIR